MNSDGVLGNAISMAYQPNGGNKSLYKIASGDFYFFMTKDGIKVLVSIIKTLLLVKLEPIKPSKIFTNDPTAALYTYDYDSLGNKVDQLDVYYGLGDKWKKETFDSTTGKYTGKSVEYDLTGLLNLSLVFKKI